MTRRVLFLFFLLACRHDGAPTRTGTGTATAGATSTRFAVDQGGLRLVVEAAGDGTVHFELAPASAPFDPARPIFMSPMVKGSPPATGTRVGERGLAVGDLAVEVDDQLCANVERAGVRLTRVCPTLAGGKASLAIDPPAGASTSTDGFGLGQACAYPDTEGAAWAGRKRLPGNEYGNKMESFDGGACGNTQIPVLYGVGLPARPFAVFVDEPRAQTWDLTGATWSMTTAAPALRWYVIGGGDLPAVRARYMDLTGHPPVPPRAAFGLWVSEYGYEDWAELDAVHAELTKKGFPVSGFVLDLQWFGGIREGAEDTSMGKVDWDTVHFPDPAGKIAALRAKGVGIIPIEESYIGRALPEHARLAESGHLVMTKAGAPVYLDKEPWWGKGGMIDWSSQAAGDFWHDWKRKPLVDAGVTGHWTDLGEPEQFDPEARYHGFAGIGTDEAAVHNLYNLAWAESIARGYARQRSRRRPFILTRSGTAGIQRTGAAMWSGDLGSRYTTIAMQQRNQVNMSMSGIDFYGSDVGGFYRKALTGHGIDGLYTTWLENASLTEVPVRPHTFNIEEKYETSPARVGDRAKNLAALRLRYELIPYLYSLAHLAHRDGTPVFPPPFFYYPDEPALRVQTWMKMIGRDLLALMKTQPPGYQREPLLPPGTWHPWSAAAPHLLARAGAIIPLADPDGGLRVRVYPDETKTTFTLFEDDGETIAYETGAVRETAITQVRSGKTITIAIEAAKGSYDGAPAARALTLEIAHPGGAIASVTQDGKTVPFSVEGPLVVAGLPAAPVTTARMIEIQLR
ncbi:MAG TPA: TIM-barrel domain-containing protein [Kofleriaceae bacterium]|nr:TIM-barrel domain-containing protein [Kofleriaceae bacterium]